MRTLKDNREKMDNYSAVLTLTVKLLRKKVSEYVDAPEVCFTGKAKGFSTNIIKYSTLFLKHTVERGKITKGQLEKALNYTTKTIKGTADGDREDRIVIQLSKMDADRVAFIERITEGLRDYIIEFKKKLLYGDFKKIVTIIKYSDRFLDSIAELEEEFLALEGEKCSG